VDDLRWSALLLKIDEADAADPAKINAIKDGINALIQVNLSKRDAGRSDGPLTSFLLSRTRLVFRSMT